MSAIVLLIILLSVIGFVLLVDELNIRRRERRWQKQITREIDEMIEGLLPLGNCDVIPKEDDGSR